MNFNFKADGDSSESTQQELSNEYQHDRVWMVFKNCWILVLWTKVGSALEGLRGALSVNRIGTTFFILWNKLVRKIDYFLIFKKFLLSKKSTFLLPLEGANFIKLEFALWVPVVISFILTINNKRSL